MCPFIVFLQTKGSAHFGTQPLYNKVNLSSREKRFMRLSLTAKLLY